jgi:diguanylate cyclase (GGDEF)-like protein/PAS domain S-box-containing protein
MNSPSSRLLIVDDNETDRKMLARRLERKGYLTNVTGSAHQLVECVKKERVDLVLLDVEMPGINGLEALKTLREVYSPIELPIIMVTANNGSAEIANALNLGASDYLTKPIDFHVALARIGLQISHKRAKEALTQSEERYALAARGANDGLWDWNLVNNVMYFSPRWKAMLGYEEIEIGERPEEWWDRIHDADRERVKKEIAAHQGGLSPHFENEHRMRHKDGTFRWMLSRGLAVRDTSGKVSRMAGSQTDISEGKLSDALTGLPNRLLFLDRLGSLLKRAKRSNDRMFAVLFLDLDGFKMINDSMGHVVGDQLLIAVADRFEKCLRVSDTVTRLMEPFTIARLGGDEFTILLDAVKDPSDATRAAERLMKELTAPFNLGGKEVFTSASIGIALSNSSYERPEDLLRNADTAMYRAKAQGKSRYEVFDEDMRASVTSRLQLETDIRRAVERREFRNFYQPILSLRTGRIVGFEALLRWQHPTRGLVGPGEFILVAEETGLIRQLGWWNLQEACQQVNAWQNRFGGDRNLTISVNISGKQFAQPCLVGEIEKLVRELAIRPGTLKLEITESTVMEDPLAAVEMLLQIKSLGLLLAIDDFGTGYSSLSYLHRFPLDTLKIDRSFITAMRRGGEGKQIVGTILTLANNLMLDVTAEGVETKEQIDLLKELRCDYAQGFYYSKPVAAEEAGKLLARTWDVPELTDLKRYKILV